MNKPNRLQMFLIKLRAGHPFSPVEDLGQLKDHAVIRYKHYFIDVMVLEDGTLRLGWSEDPHMFPDVNINEFWTSQPPQKGTQVEI